MQFVSIILISGLLGQVPGAAPPVPTDGVRPEGSSLGGTSAEGAKRHSERAEEDRQKESQPKVSGAAPRPRRTSEGQTDSPQPPAVLESTARPRRSVGAEAFVPMAQPPGAEQGTPLVPLPSGDQELTPPEMVAEAIQLPPGGSLKGRPMTLLGTLARAHDRRRQLEVTHAYWRLVAAVGEYHFRFGQHQRLERFQARGEDAMSLRTARASAAASLSQAELAVVLAQHELAQMAQLPTDDPLPLPADPPHVGPYSTHFHEIFSMRAAPARVRLIERTLPIRRRAIDVRATAIEAARDVLEAVLEEYRLGRADLPAVLSCMSQWIDQHTALVRSVCDYNHDIADYALTIADPQTTRQALVSMLIKPEKEKAVPVPKPEPEPESDTGRADHPVETASPPAASSGVQPAHLNEPLPAESPSALRPSRRDRPTPAPPREGEELPKPTAARPVVPISADQHKRTLRTAVKPAIASQEAFRTVPAGFYPALVAAAPIARTKQLTLALNWNRSLGEEVGESIELKECLRTSLTPDRRGLIEAYWTARQRAAEYQAIAQQGEMLGELAPLVSTDARQPAASEPARRVRAVKLATDADLLEAHARLIKSQFELTRRVGRPLDSDWLFPATAPHSGRYLLKFDAQAPELVRTWPLRRLADRIPRLADAVEQRSAAVVQADTARAEAVAGYRTRGHPIDRVLEAIHRQTDQTLAFLQTLTDYNLAIAEYATAVLPPGSSSDTLVTTLVVSEQQAVGSKATHRK